MKKRKIEIFNFKTEKWKEVEFIDLKIGDVFRIYDIVKLNTRANKNGNIYKATVKIHTILTDTRKLMLFHITTTKYISFRY